MHTWDCPCGTRNAPEFRKCRACGNSAAYGNIVTPPQAPEPPPVYYAPPPVQQHPQPPARRDPWAWTPKGMIGWGVAGIGMFVLTWLFSTPGLYSWILLIVGLIFFIAGHIIEASRR